MNIYLGTKIELEALEIRTVVKEVYYNIMRIVLIIQQKGKGHTFQLLVSMFDAQAMADFVCKNMTKSRSCHYFNCRHSIKREQF